MTLTMEEWRNNINDEIDSINRSLSYAPVREKASTIRDWIRSVLGKIVHYYYYIQSRKQSIADRRLLEAQHSGFTTLSSMPNRQSTQ